MELSGWKRVKHGELPGDVSRGRKIFYREHPTSSPVARAFSNSVKAHTKVRLKERTRAKP